MLRTVLLVAVLGLLLWWWLRRPQRRDPLKPSGGERPAGGAAGRAAETMVRCAECGLHLPLSQALPGRGGHFCGAPHRQDFEQRHPE